MKKEIIKLFTIENGISISKKALDRLVECIKDYKSLVSFYATFKEKFDGSTLDPEMIDQLVSGEKNVDDNKTYLLQEFKYIPFDFYSRFEYLKSKIMWKITPVSLLEDDGTIFGILYRGKNGKFVLEDDHEAISVSFENVDSSVFVFENMFLGLSGTKRMEEVAIFYAHKVILPEAQINKSKNSFLKKNENKIVAFGCFDKNIGKGLSFEVEGDNSDSKSIFNSNSKGLTSDNQCKNINGLNNSDNQCIDNQNIILNSKDISSDNKSIYSDNKSMDNENIKDNKDINSDNQNIDIKDLDNQNIKDVKDVDNQNIKDNKDLINQNIKDNKDINLDSRNTNSNSMDKQNIIKDNHIINLNNLINQSETKNIVKDDLSFIKNIIRKENPNITIVSTHLKINLEKALICSSRKDESLLPSKIQNITNPFILEFSDSKIGFLDYELFKERSNGVFYGNNKGGATVRGFLSSVISQNNINPFVASDLFVSEFPNILIVSQSSYPGVFEIGSVKVLSLPPGNYYAVLDFKNQIFEVVGEGEFKGIN